MFSTHDNGGGEILPRERRPTLTEYRESPGKRFTFAIMGHGLELPSEPLVNPDIDIRIFSQAGTLGVCNVSETRFLLPILQGIKESFSEELVKQNNSTYQVLKETLNSLNPSYTNLLAALDSINKLAKMSLRIYEIDDNDDIKMSEILAFITEYNTRESFNPSNNLLPPDSVLYGLHDKIKELEDMYETYKLNTPVKYISEREHELTDQNYDETLEKITREYKTLMHSNRIIMKTFYIDEILLLLAPRTETDVIDMEKIGDKIKKGIENVSKGEHFRTYSPVCNKRYIVADKNDSGVFVLHDDNGDQDPSTEAKLMEWIDSFDSFTLQEIVDFCKANEYLVGNIVDFTCRSVDSENESLIASISAAEKARHIAINYGGKTRRIKKQKRQQKRNKTKRDKTRKSRHRK